jgi:DNA mismatch repair protein MutL
VIFQVIYACIKEALGRNSFGASLDFDRGDMPEIPALGRNFEEFRPIAEPQPGLDPTFNPFDNDGFPAEESHFDNTYGGQPSVFGSMPSGSGQQMFPSDWSEGAAAFDKGATTPYRAGGNHGTSGYVDRRDDYGKLFEDKIAPTRALMVLQGKYILTQGRSGLMVINIRRAMERIMYDRFLDALSRNEHVTQTTLFPVSVQVGVENMCLFEEHFQMLSNLGFDIAPFGTDTIVVNGVPEGYSAEAGKVQTMIGDLLLVLSEDHNALAEMMTANLAAGLSRIGSCNSDEIKNPQEAQRLIDSLFACANAEYTNTGRRIISILPIEELDKRF